MGSNIVDIDPEGDVLFIVNNDGAISEATNEHVALPTSVEANHDVELVRNEASTPSDEIATAISGRARACSKHLTLASRVFKSMLQPKSFKEGHDLCSNGTIEITLSHDWEAFLILLNIIHGKFYKVPDELDIIMLANVAKLVDYYGLHETVVMYQKVWIDNLIKKRQNPQSLTEELLPWISICWVFERNQDFEIATKLLEKESENSVIDCTWPMPDKTLDKIEVQRQRILSEGFSELSKVLETYTSSVRQCKNENPDCDATVLGSLTRELEFAKLLSIQQKPYRGLSCDTLIRQIRNLEPTSLCDILKHSNQHRNKKKRYGSSDKYGMEFSIHKTCDVKYLLNQISDSLEQKLCGQTLNN